MEKPEYVQLYRYAKSDYAMRAGRFKENCVPFKVRKDWLEDYVKRNFNMSLEEFLDEYTWDWTSFDLYEDALAAGAVKA